MEGLKNVADVIAAKPRQGALAHRRNLHAVQRDGAGRRAIQSCDETQQGGFSASRRTDNGHALLIGNLQCDVVEDRDLMAAAGQAHRQMREGNHVVGPASTVSSTSGLYYTG